MARLNLKKSRETAAAPASIDTASMETAPVAHTPIIPTLEQSACWDHMHRMMTNDEPNLVVNAVAGSGKTFTALEGAKRLQRLQREEGRGRLDIRYLAFNKSVQAEMQVKAGDSLTAQTFHSFGLRAITQQFGPQDINKDRAWKVLDRVAGMSKDKRVRGGVVKLIRLVKQYGVGVGEEWRDGVWDVIDRHGLELADASLGDEAREAMEEEIVGWVPRTLAASMELVKGEGVDFDDMIWLPYAHGLRLGRAKLLVVDEAQDLNLVQQWFAVESGERAVVIGDRNQCHPAGTMISMTGGGCKPIEQVKEGDKVVTYASKNSQFRGVGSQGRQVETTHKSWYSGPLINFRVGQHQIQATPNHRMHVRIPRGEHGYCVYLMVKGIHARIGMCRLQYNHGLGISMRARQEKAEKAWILTVFENATHARIAEEVLAAKYGLPQMIFHNAQQTTPPQAIIDAVYSLLPGNLSRAKELLREYEREWEFPMWEMRDSNGNGSSHQGAYSFITEACNVLTCMEMRTFDGAINSGQWEKVQVESTDYKGWVYGLRVEPTEGGRRLYVANNVVVHNSIYAFRGADSKSIDRLADAVGATELMLTVTRRCPIRVVELAQKIVPHIKWWDGAGEGVVEEVGRERLMRDVVEGDMVLCRNNAPLVALAFQLIKAGKSARIRGRDIHDGIMELLRKSAGGAGVGIGVGKLSKVLMAAQQFTDDEVERFEAMKEGRGEERAARAMDRLECLLACAGGCATVEELTMRLGELFREDRVGITLSSVHKAKGLEGERVWVLEPGLLGLRRGKQNGEQYQQELNLTYVAVTRARKELRFVGEMPRVLKG